MTTTERYFPTDQELEQWMQACVADAGNAPTHLVDQVRAAARESTNRIMAATPSLIANGTAKWAFNDHTGKPDNDQLRGVALMIMVAMSAGVSSLCDHTQMIRPLLLICDPPMVVCFKCIHSGRVDMMATAKAAGHLWDHQCDRCGVHTKMLSACTVSGFGPLTVSGHICTSCADQDRRRAEQLADGVILVNRNRATRRKRQRRP